MIVKSYYNCLYDIFMFYSWNSVFLELQKRKILYLCFYFITAVAYTVFTLAYLCKHKGSVTY